MCCEILQRFRPENPSLFVKGWAFSSNSPLETCHGQSCHVSLGSSPSDLRDRCKYCKTSAPQNDQMDCEGWRRKGWEGAVAEQNHWPALSLVPRSKCRRQSGCKIWLKEEGLTLHIRGPLQLCDRTKAPAYVPDRRTLLQPVLREDQTGLGQQHMAQVAEQACPHW